RIAGGGIAAQEHLRIMPVRFHDGGRFFEERNGFACAALAEIESRRLAIGLPRVRVEPKRRFDFGVGFVLLSLFLEGMRLYAARLGEVWIDRQRPLGGS